MTGLLVVCVLVYAPHQAGGSDLLVQAAGELRQALRAGGAEVIEGALGQARALDEEGWAPAAELGFFARGRGLTEAARRALERVEWEGAAALYAQAEALYAAELARPGVPTLAGEAALGRGVALFELGRSAEAVKAFRRAAALDGALRLTEADVRPDVVRAFARAVDGARPRGALRVRVKDGEGATISIDGAPAVAAAGGAFELPEGEHLVVARRAGARPAARLVEVPAGGAEVTLTLLPDPLAAALAELSGRPGRAAAARLASLLGADEVVTAAVGRDAGKAVVVARRVTRAGCVSPQARADGGGDLGGAPAKVIAALHRTEVLCGVDAEGTPEVTEARPIRAPRPAPLVVEKPPPPRKKRFHERPWLWLGLLAVSSVGVGLAVGLATRGQAVEAGLDGQAFAE